MATEGKAVLGGDQNRATEGCETPDTEGEGRSSLTVGECAWNECVC